MRGSALSMHTGQHPALSSAGGAGAVPSEAGSTQPEAPTPASCLGAAHDSASALRSSLPQLTSRPDPLHSHELHRADKSQPRKSQPDDESQPRESHRADESQPRESPAVPESNLTMAPTPRSRTGQASHEEYEVIVWGGQPPAGRGDVVRASEERDGSAERAEGSAAGEGAAGEAAEAVEAAEAAEAAEVHAEQMKEAETETEPQAAEETVDEQGQMEGEEARNNNRPRARISPMRCMGPHRARPSQRCSR